MVRVGRKKKIKRLPWKYKKNEYNITVTKICNKEQKTLPPFVAQLGSFAILSILTKKGYGFVRVSHTLSSNQKYEEELS